jgi:NADH:ubiquinone oxidoreductase subunit K
MSPTLEPFLHLAALLLSLGVYGLLARRDAHSAVASLQIMAHAIVIALVALSRGTHPRTAADAGFADAFGALVIMLLGVQAVIGLSLVHHRRPARDATAREATPPNEPRRAR